MKDERTEKSPIDPENQAPSLRQQAERSISESVPKSPGPTVETKDELLHELEVHQIELEVQNEELRRTQEELKASRDRFADLYDFAPVGYLTLDEHNLVLEANLSLCRMLATDRSSLLRKRIAEFIDGRSADSFYACLKAVRQSGDKQSCEAGMKRADGSRFEALLEMISEKGLRVSVTDITEHKQEESKIIDSEKRYRNLFENMIDGYAYCQMIFENGEPADFIYLAVNSAFEKLTGLKEVVGKKVSQVVPGLRDSNPELLKIYGRVASSGKAEQFEMYVAPLKIWFAVSVYSVEKGTFTSIFENITQRKDAEEEAEHYIRDLEVANKELEAFSYSVSHDLRQPLRALDGFSLAVMEDYGDKLDQRGKEYLNLVREASQRMSELIENMLRLSRISRAEMQYIEVNLGELAESIAANLKSLHPERKAEFRISPEMQVKGDKQLLLVAVRNLLDNAWKFTGQCPETRIEFGVKQENGEKVYFIKDNGAGFDMAYGDKLFQPFQRLHSEKEYEGIGVGLAIVQRIIRRHGGRVWAEGEVGKGATFYFTLS